MSKNVTDTKTFIEKAKSIHSDYEYSKTIYDCGNKLYEKLF